MGILDRIFQEAVERGRGRIFITPGCWVFGTVEGALHRTDADRKPMSCVHKRGVFCPNPDVGVDYPRSNDGPWWFVPWVRCRKCSHYQKSTRKVRYPTCNYKASHQPEKDALADTLGVVISARKFADDIIGG